MRLPILRFLCLLVLLFTASVRAAEPFFKKGDVVALVGGEDMVVACEEGYLETLLARALPDYHLRFRSLAWEGDTVFEQRRDLNFPSWEEQFDKVGATVVICQFGQSESLGGKDKLPEFMAAYEKLLERFSDGGKRRIAIVEPSPFDPRNRLGNLASARNANIRDYAAALSDLAVRQKAALVKFTQAAADPNNQVETRDGVHLANGGQKDLAWQIGTTLAPQAKDLQRVLGTGLEPGKNSDLEKLLGLIVAKNLLWFNYWRPQNWAFLAGDRTNQPSSRDWRDPSIRWFPPEREEFIPLVEAKEKEIDALALKLAQP